MTQEQKSTAAEQKCPYRTDRMQKLDPPIEIDGIKLTELPLALCGHKEKIKETCVIFEGNVSDCGWINDVKTARTTDELPLEDNKYYNLLKDKCLSFKVLSSVKTEPNGIASFEKDTNGIATTLVFSEDTNEPSTELITKGNRIFPHEFSLCGVGVTPKERVEDLVKKENALCMQLLIESATLYNDSVIASTDIKYDEAPWKGVKEFLEGIQYRVKQNRLLVDKFLINEIFMKKMLQHPGAMDIYDSSVEDRCGCRGNVWGVNLFELAIETLPFAPPLVIGVTEGRYLGARTVRYLCEVNDPVNGTFLLLMGSMCIYNVRSLAIGTTEQFSICKVDSKKILDELKQYKDKSIK